MLHIQNNVRLHNRNETYRDTTRRMRDDINKPLKSETKQTNNTPCWICSSRLLIGSHPGSRIRRLCWHLLSSAGNTWLPIQFLVLWITLRCHYFVAHSAYPSFRALIWTVVGCIVIFVLLQCIVCLKFEGDVWQNGRKLFVNVLRCRVLSACYGYCYIYCKSGHRRNNVL
jgi:hypothetical protein